MRTTERRSRSAPRPEVVDRLWSMEDLSAYLGVPVATIYQWRSRGEAPPAFRVGRFVRFEPAEVQAWLRERPR